MMNRAFFWLILFWLPAAVQAQPPAPSQTPTWDFTKAPGFAYPDGTAKGNAIIRHTYFTLAYDEAREVPQWVAYELKDFMVKGEASRKNMKFRQDPLVKTGSAEPRWYGNSGYTRGHMAPAADFKWDSLAMNETFYMSNICPQLQSHNGGVWERIEDGARKWARAEGRVFIVCGPIYDRNRTTIGTDSRVEIPDAFFKVILDADGDNRKAIGFITPHADIPEKEFMNYAVTVDEVERVTGLDFWPQIPDPLEAELESKLDLEAWQKAIPVR